MKVLMFTGKGGVGKSTCAAAAAKGLAKRYKVLLVSTDYQPSLTSILKVDARGRKASLGNLDVLELDEEITRELWRKRFGEEVFRVISSFLNVDREIIDYVAEAPSIPEQFSLAMILWELPNYDYVVWDTSPVGGTLRLIRIEKEFYEHLGQAASLYLKVRGTLDRIRRGGEDPLTILRRWRKLAEDIFEMLRDRTTSYVVTTPEELPLREAERAVKELRSFGIKVGGVIVNQVMSEDVLAVRLELQKKRVEEAKNIFGRIVVIPMYPEVTEEELNLMFERLATFI